MELIQPHSSSWNWPDPPPERVSPLLSVRRLAEVVAGSADPEADGRRFEKLFGMAFECVNGDVTVPFPNACRLRFRAERPGLQTLVLESADPKGDLEALKATGTPAEAGTAPGEVRIPAAVTGFEIVLRDS